jgi:uridine phosphorylase
MGNNLQPHIRCCDEDAADYAILPGDPERVERIRGFLDNTKDIAYNREFKTITGYYKGIKVMATSTGIGGASTCIAVEELKNIGVNTLIRIGSCGANQKGMRLGDIVIACGAVRNEGTSLAYVEKGYPAIPDTELMFNIIKAAKELGANYHCGIIRSHDSFYTDNEDAIDEFWSKKGILASDMETAPLFVIGGLRGLRTASILNVVVEYNASLENGINDYVNGENATKKGEENEILTALEAIVSIDTNTKVERL